MRSRQGAEGFCETLSQRLQLRYAAACTVPAHLLVPGLVQALPHDVAVMLDAEPIHALADGLDGVLIVPLGIRVLNPEAELPAKVPGVEEAEECRASTSNVEVACRRKGQSCSWLDHGALPLLSLSLSQSLPSLLLRWIPSLPSPLEPIEDGGSRGPHFRFLRVPFRCPPHPPSAIRETTAGQWLERGRISHPSAMARSA